MSCTGVQRMQLATPQHCTSIYCRMKMKDYAWGVWAKDEASPVAMCPVNFNQILYHCLSSIAESHLGIVLKVNLGAPQSRTKSYWWVYTDFRRRRTTSRRECDVNVLEHKVDIFYDSYGLKYYSSGKIQNSENNNTFWGVDFMCKGKQ